MPACSARSSSGRIESRASTCTRQSPGRPPPPSSAQPPVPPRDGDGRVLAQQLHASDSICISTQHQSRRLLHRPVPACASHVDGRRPQQQQLRPLHMTSWAATAGFWRTCTAATCTSGTTMIRRSSSPSRSPSCQVLALAARRLGLELPCPSCDLQTAKAPRKELGSQHMAAPPHADPTPCLATRGGDE